MKISKGTRILCLNAGPVLKYFASGVEHSLTESWIYEVTEDFDSEATTPINFSDDGPHIYVRDDNGQELAYLMDRFSVNALPDQIENTVESLKQTVRAMTQEIA